MKYLITLIFKDETGAFVADGLHLIEADSYQQARDTAQALMQHCNAAEYKIEKQ